MIQVVKAIHRLDPRALEVILAPTAQPLQFVAGQFVFVYFGGSAEWERHPFSVSSAPQERDLRLSIEALGDYTQHLSDTLQLGAPAIVSVAFGLFDYRQGTREQVWIAGGIGITPFRSWIRAFPQSNRWSSTSTCTTPCVAKTRRCSSTRSGRRPYSTHPSGLTSSTPSATGPSPWNTSSRPAVGVPSSPRMSTCAAPVG